MEDLEESWGPARGSSLAIKEDKGEGRCRVDLLSGASVEKEDPLQGRRTRRIKGTDRCPL